MPGYTDVDALWTQMKKLVMERTGWTLIPLKEGGADADMREEIDDIPMEYFESGGI